MKRFVLSAAAAIVFAYGGAALAADPPAKAPDDPAAAQALFYEARQLMKESKFGLACPKLEESLRLDYGIGTEFNLADCNEKLGKIATAWSGFINVASAARTQKQPDREKVARERAKALEPRLPKLTIEVPTGSTVEVKRDGAVVGAAAWNTAVPVDPGTHKISASAPGKVTWEGTVAVVEGKPAKISVPKELEKAAVARADSPPVTPIAPVARHDTASMTTTTSTAFPEPIDERTGSTQRTIGWIVGGIGVAGLGLGAGFGLNSYAKRQSARDNCRGDLCNAQGVDQRDAALKSGNIATVATIAGAGALLGGVVLVLTAPKGGSRKEASARGATAPPPPSVTDSLRAVPHVALNGGGLTIQGILP